MARSENIGTEIPTRDSVTSRELDSRPPLGINQRLVTQPVRDQLLAGGVGGIAEGSHLLGQGSLATSKLDGSIKSGDVRGNVVSLHDFAKYTNGFVRSTTTFVRQPDKETCIVLTMPTTSRKPAARPQLVSPKVKSGKRQAKTGRDGRTLGDRLALAMAYESGKRGREYRQADLLYEVNSLAKAPADSPVMTQQMLSAIMRNTVSRTSLSPLLAAACHVNPLWLSDGIGEMILS